MSIREPIDIIQHIDHITGLNTQDLIITGLNT